MAKGKSAVSPAAERTAPSTRFPGNTKKRKQAHETNQPVKPNIKRQDQQQQRQRPEKRRKFQDAREIVAQSADEAFKDGQLDVASFINARQYEIESLRESMNRSKHAQRKRAFQSLPREMRRRTASHNPNRVPKRVRQVARKEMAEDKTVPPKKRRNFRPFARHSNAGQLKKLSAETTANSQKGHESESLPIPWPRIKPKRYGKRQKNKTWLPTHLWMAKRARMIQSWGFSIAKTPTLKCFRPTYRAASWQGCVVFDTSYMATLTLEGSEARLKNCLREFLQPRDEALALSRFAGSKSISTWIFENKAWPQGATAPVKLFWCPVQDDASTRKLVLRVHPAALESVSKIINDAAGSWKCTVKSLRYEIGSIHLIGPGATDSLKTLLDPAGDNLAPVEDLALASPNLLLQASVIDPRLNRTRSRRQEACTDKGQSQSDTMPKPVSLFNASDLHKSIRAHVSQKTINSHFSSVATQETDAIPMRYKVPIPICLLRESFGDKASLKYSNSETSSDAFNSWTVMLPWKWVKDFWLVLIRQLGVRFGGEKELEQLTLESGVGSYPCDFTATPQGKIEALRRFQEKKQSLERRQGIKTKAPAKEASDITGPAVLEYGYPWDDAFAPAERSTQTPAKLELWHLPPDLYRILIQSNSKSLPATINNSIFTVRLRLHSHGNIRDDARIYHLPHRGTQEFKNLKLQYDGKMKLPLDVVQGQKGPVESEPVHNEPDKTNRLIGFVTRSNFGLRDGICIAIGVLAWGKVYERKLNQSQIHLDAGWCVLENKVHGVRRLARWSAI